MHTIIPLSDFEINPTAYRFEGGIYGDVFLVQERKVAFVVGSETVIVNSGNVVIVPALTPHKFTNVGTTPLRMCGIHPTKEVIQYQLEE